MTIRRRSDNLIRWKGPTRASDGTVLNQAYLTANGGTIVMRVYEERMTYEVVELTTRLRADVAAGAVTLTVPHCALQVFATGDQVEVQNDTGEFEQRQITFAAGTDESTPATNFDTLTIPGLGEAASAGNLVRLTKRATAAPNLAVVALGSGTQIPFNTCEIETDVPNVFDNEIIARMARTQWTEDGALAANQPNFALMHFIGTTVGAISPGRKIRRRVDGTVDVTMTEYGTEPTWTDLPAGGGFEATFADDLLDIETGALLRLAFILSGIPALEAVTSILETVVDG